MYCQKWRGRGGKEGEKEKVGEKASDLPQLKVKKRHLLLEIFNLPSQLNTVVFKKKILKRTLCWQKWFQVDGSENPAAKKGGSGKEKEKGKRENEGCEKRGNFPEVASEEGKGEIIAGEIIPPFLFLSPFFAEQEAMRIFPSFCQGFLHEKEQEQILSKEELSNRGFCYKKACFSM